MIQFNLLPDVKLEFVKARKMERLVILVSLVASATAIFVLVLFVLNVDVVQKKSLRDLNHDIGSNKTTLKSVPQLDKILTVQNQLNTLTGLHDSKVVSSQLFGYLAQLTPTNVTISDITLDFTANTATATGGAPALDAVNKFVDTLKSTTYKATDGSATGSTPPKAFSQVVLSAFATSDKGATYTVTFSFDPKIFGGTTGATLQVPNGTVSNTSILFKKVGN